MRKINLLVFGFLVSGRVEGGRRRDNWRERGDGGGRGQRGEEGGGEGKGGRREVAR